MKRLLLFLNLSVLLISCGEDRKAQIHIWAEDLTCKVISYPVWQRECGSPHFICTTHANGHVDCIFHATGAELAKKIGE